VGAGVDAVEAWEQQGRLFDIAGDRVFVIDAGGPAAGIGRRPLLVLHGFPSSSFDFRHVLPALAAGRRVVLFDFLGFGVSDKPDRRYGIRAAADTATDVIAAVGLGGATVELLTHDMGDSVGGELLARDLDGDLRFGIGRRVLTNGSIYLDLAQLTAGQQLLLSLPDEPTELVGEDEFRAGLAGTFAPGHPATDDELEGQWLLASRAGGHALLPRTIRYIEDRRAEEDRYTGAIEAHPSPLAVVWGEVDPIAVLAMTDRLLERRPGTPRTTLTGVGHYPMIEDPEAFATAVLAHLDA
jgi:pimeloyl-ACP methyl ester carboxylesterase